GSLHRAHIQDHVPAIVARNLAGVGRHIVLSVREDMKELAILHGLRVLSQQRGRWRVTPLRDGTVSRGTRPMADRAEVCEHDGAALTGPLVARRERAW